MKTYLSERRRLAALYANVAVALLALIGAVCIVCLQLGWLKVDVGPHPLEPAAGPVELASIETVAGQRGYFSDFIRVDPSRVYRLSGLFRASSDNVGQDAASRVYFGIRVYDEKQKAITGDPGAYRYPAANGVVLTGLEGWVRLQGEITGVSEEGHNSFRSGTAWIRIVVVPGYSASQVTTEVADVEFAEEVDLRPSNHGDSSN